MSASPYSSLAFVSRGSSSSIWRRSSMNLSAILSSSACGRGLSEFLSLTHFLLNQASQQEVMRQSPASLSSAAIFALRSSASFFARSRFAFSSASRFAFASALAFASAAAFAAGSTSAARTHGAATTSANAINNVCFMISSCFQLPLLPDRHRESRAAPEHFAAKARGALD